MVTLPIPGVAFDLVSLSFYVPICGREARRVKRAGASKSNALQQSRWTEFAGRLCQTPLAKRLMFCTRCLM